MESLEDHFEDTPSTPPLTRSTPAPSASTPVPSASSPITLQPDDSDEEVSDHFFIVLFLLQQCCRDVPQLTRDKKSAGVARGKLEDVDLALCSVFE
jgi:hypothetical protein